MTIYTKTITAGLALILAGAPLIGTVSADTDEFESNGTVSFADDEGGLILESADNIEFGQVDLSSLSDFHPVANNQESGEVKVKQTSANTNAAKRITVQQTGDWQFGIEVYIGKNSLPIKYGNDSLTGDAVTFCQTIFPRGNYGIDFDHENKKFTLDLTGTGNLNGGLNKDLTSEVTWTLTDAI